ncbi:hypothetical protein Q3G72_026804 [Acer saccharum]|nr:hypothetical protein Q3G72_026804 [Acer saccharum]
MEMALRDGVQLNGCIRRESQAECSIRRGLPMAAVLELAPLPSSNSDVFARNHTPRLQLSPLVLAASFFF